MESYSLVPEDSPEVAMSSAMENLAPGSIIAVGDVCAATLLKWVLLPILQLSMV